MRSASVARSPRPCERRPRAILFPRQATKEDFKQLTAEHLQRQDPRERGKWVKPQGVANEQLDLAVYCLAGAINSRLDDLSDLGWADLMAKRAPDLVKQQLTPLERLMLPDDDAEHAGAAPAAAPLLPLAPPPAEGRRQAGLSKEDLEKIRAMARKARGDS